MTDYPTSFAGQSWRDRAACKDAAPRDAYGTDWFFPEYTHAMSAAIKVCQACPVRNECLQWALDNNEAYGVWGGLTEAERWSLMHGGQQRKRLADRCVRGHLFTEDNTYIRPGRGGRQCRTCQNERKAQRNNNATEEQRKP